MDDLPGDSCFDEENGAALAGKEKAKKTERAGKCSKKNKGQIKPSVTMAPPALTTGGDRSFDDLSARFSANIYGTRKGQLRLDILAADFKDHLGIDWPKGSILDSGTDMAVGRQLLILDAGGGIGQFSAQLAAQV